MDPRTAQFYAANAVDLARRYIAAGSAPARHFPIALIADKWLEYFWPLFESPIFIPQKRGEKPHCLKPVAFRAELDQLITLAARLPNGVTLFLRSGGTCALPHSGCGRAIPQLFRCRKGC
jgi:hypothetical protein